MDIGFAPQFRRQFRKLPQGLQEEVLGKIELFKNIKNHERLRVHKLQRALEGRLSFSVTYRHRIVFKWERRNRSAILLAVGDHPVYDA